MQGSNSLPKVKLARFAVGVAIVSLAASACSFGSSSSESVGVPTFGKGVITAKGSVFVNGIEYDTSATKITVDDAIGSDADLKVGMVVELKGSADAASGLGVADELLYSADVDGPIGSIDAANNTFSVFGRTISVNAATMWEGATGIADLIVGDRVEVSGMIDATSSLLQADRVEKKVGSSEDFETKGTVSALGSNSFTLTPPDGGSTLTVNFTGTLAPSIVDGAKVELKFSSIVGSVITTTADKIKGESKLEADDNSRAEVSGHVSGLLAGPTTTTFTVDDIQVSAANTLLPAGLANGSEVEVEGTMSAGVLVAEKVKAEKESNAELRGSVSSASVALGTLSLDGVTVSVDATTRFEDEDETGGVVPVEHFGLPDIIAGNYLEVSGFYDAAAVPSFIAEKVVRKAAAATSVIQGPVGAMDASSLTILGVPIDVSAAALKDASGGAVASIAAFEALVTLNATIVKAKGSFAAGTLTASSASIDD